MTASLTRYLASLLLLLAALLIPLDALAHAVAPQSCVVQPCSVPDLGNLPCQGSPAEDHKSSSYPDDHPCCDECDSFSDLTPPSSPLLARLPGQEGSLIGMAHSVNLPELPFTIYVPPQN